VAVAGLVYYLLTRNKKEEANFIKVSGNIEALRWTWGSRSQEGLSARFFEEGDWVDQGKVLAKLDDEDLRNRLEVARATLMSGTSPIGETACGVEAGRNKASRS